MITRRQHEESVASIKFRVDGEVLAGRCIVIPEVRTRDESCCSVGLGRLPAAYKEANASILPDDIVFRIHLLQNTMMDHVVTVQRLRGGARADCEDDGIVELGLAGADLELLAEIVL